MSRISPRRSGQPPGFSRATRCFPHLSVFENVAFGLRVRRLPREEIATRVADALKLVKMETFTERNAAQLSGGQQQRSLWRAP
jgi:ABC-type Fe3+/spermidine/putrescine transport system ATPase subunit